MIHNENLLKRRCFQNETGSVLYLYYENHVERHYFDEEGNEQSYYYVRRNEDNHKEWIMYDTEEMY